MSLKIAPRGKTTADLEYRDSVRERARQNLRLRVANRAVTNLKNNLKTNSKIISKTKMSVVDTEKLKMGPAFSAQSEETEKLEIEASAIAPVRNQNGMTLIEIMIVIAIIAGLMAVLGTSANGFLQKSRVSNAKIAMKELGKQLEAYNLSCNSYPTTDQGLQALLQPPGEGCPNWGPEPYVKKGQLMDPWGKPFIYESDGGKFVIRSLGRDRKEGGTGYDKDLSSEDEE